MAAWIIQWPLITLLFRIPLGTQPNLSAFASDLVHWSKPSSVSLCHWWQSPLWAKCSVKPNLPWLTELLEEKKIQKCQFKMTYIIHSLQPCLSFTVATKSWWGRERKKKRISKTTAIYFYFPREVSVISLLDTICVSYSTHKKPEKHARKGEIFSVSPFLWKLWMSSSVFFPFNGRDAHPSALIFFSFSIDDVRQAL